MHNVGISLFALTLAASPLSADEESTRVPLRYEGLNRTKYLELKQVLGHPEQSATMGHTAALSRDGKLGLFAGGGSVGIDGRTDESFLSLWDVPAARTIQEVRILGKAITVLALSPDGKSALTGLYGNDGKGKETTELVLWSLGDGKRVHTFAPPKPGPKEPGITSFFAAAFSPDGKRALAAAGRADVQTLDLESGKVLAGIRLRKEDANSSLALLFAGPDRTFVAWGADIHLCDLAKGRSIRVFQGHEMPVLSLALSADGKRLASAALDATVRLWDVASGKEVASLAKKRSNAPLINITFTADDRIFTVSSDDDPMTRVHVFGAVSLWDPAAKKEIWARESSLEGLVPVAVQGEEAILGGGANAFCTWDLTKGVEKKVWGGHKSPVTALAALPDGRLVSGSEDGVMKLWRDGNAHHRRGHDATIFALNTGPDDFLLSASADGIVTLWNGKTGKAVKSFRHGDTVTGAVFGPGGKWIASAGGDRVIRAWDRVTGKPIAEIAGHSEGINALAIRPGGKLLATASDDNTVRLWPIEDGKLVEDADVAILEGHKRQVTSLAFTPDGKHLLSGSQDKTIRVWDVERERTVKILEGHRNWISSVLVWNEKAVSTADDFRVIVWDLKAGKAVDGIDFMPYGDSPRSLALTADGNGFYVGTSGWVVMRFDLLKKR